MVSIWSLALSENALSEGRTKRGIAVLEKDKPFEEKLE